MHWVSLWTLTHDRLTSDLHSAPSSCVPFGKCLNLSRPQFLNLKNEDNYKTYLSHRAIMTLNELIHVNHLKWCPACSRQSVNVSYL